MNHSRKHVNADDEEEDAEYDGNNNLNSIRMFYKLEKSTARRRGADGVRPTGPRREGNGIIQFQLVLPTHILHPRFSISNTDGAAFKATPFTAVAEAAGCFASISRRGR